jgi:hypothetical protein
MSSFNAGAVRRVGVAERRARLAARHRLAPSARAQTVPATAADIIALHGTDPASVYLAAWARTRDADLAAIEHALYTERSLVRMLGMRRTVFVVPAGLAPVIQAACTDEIAARLRRRLAQDISAAGIAADADAWLAAVGEATVRALAARGTATGAELSKDEPRLRTQIVYAEGKSYGGTANITSRLLTLLSAEGLIVRGRPRGGWTSTQFTWSVVESPVIVPLSEARAELARRWLWTFGPALPSDLQWWTGWNAGQIRKVLSELDVVEVDLDGAPGIMLADDTPRPDNTEPDSPRPDSPEPDNPRPDNTEPDSPETKHPEVDYSEVEPWAALLPALDPTAMGWRERGWYVGDHVPALFDRSGNIGPTVWWDGRIVGGWAQRADGEIAVRLLEDIGSEGVAAVADQAERLGEWIGAGVRITPRFRTPLERELAG